MRLHPRVTTSIIAGVLSVMVVVLAWPAHSASPVLLPTSTNYADIPYPHVMLYSGVNSNGWPLVGSIEPTGQCSTNPATACMFDSDCGGYTCQNTTSRFPSEATPLNASAIAKVAQFPMVTMPPTPIVDVRTDIVPALRAANPNIKIFAYVMPSTSWCVSGGYPAGVYYGDVRELAASFDARNAPYRSSCLTFGDGFLRMQDGGISSDSPHNFTENINLAKRVQQPDLSYTYPVADAMAELVFSKVYQAHLYDGIFHDVFSSQVLWMESLTSKFDYQANGYGTNNADPANRAAFGAGWTAGFEAYGKRLRELIVAAGDPTFPLTGNGGLSDSVLHSSFNGWMRENFPYLAGGSWYTNMYDPTVGYLIDNQSFRAPQINMLFGASDPWWDPYTTGNNRLARFTLGSASLGEGFGIYQERSVSVYASPAQHLWYDEYGVRTDAPHASAAYGQADNVQYRGWLGQPTTDAYQMIWANTNPELVTNSDFETNTTGWTMSSFSPAAASMTRETSGAPVGSADVRATVTSASTAGWQASFQSTTTFSITQGLEHSVTFWAKADHARTIEVILDKLGGGGYATQLQPLTTEWKRYQIRLVPNTSTTGVNVRFDMANETGSVWLDDVHVQLGITSVYRRDFDRGIVLVNPSNGPMTPQLEKPYKKILGLRDQVVNDGSVVSAVTLAGSQSNNDVGDALFLLNLDLTAPSTVSNLQAE